MGLQAPELDDRRFADIFNEARGLIQRYTPEWTDHNEHDPGITLIQLFAWMADMMLYRLNQVPERNYIKFLQLLGLELRPAHPAHAELTFTLARRDLDTVIVPQGTQVAAAAGGAGGGPLIFETDQSLNALGATLSAIQVFDGFAYSIETKKNAAPGQWFYAFGPLARAGSALILGFDSPLPFTQSQINLAINVYTQGLQRGGQHCDLDLTQMPVLATLAWEFWDGRFWQPLGVDKDETRALTRSGHIYFPGPGGLARKDKLGLAKDTPLYWLRLRLVDGQYETAPRLSMILTNTIGASQTLTERDEVLGGSDGSPNQTFQLANQPVVGLATSYKVKGADSQTIMITSLRLEVDEGLGFLAWQEVDDFFASTAEDPHYMLNRTTGLIQFGNGINGRIPLANLKNARGNIVARLYRHGGGVMGNAGAGTISEMQSSVDSVQSVSNLLPAFGGSDEESVEHAKLRAPQELKSKNRAVTADDFEYLAEATPGVRVRRAKALPLMHPQFPGVPIPGVITVIVVPEGDAPNPLPGEATLRTVCAHLDEHRLLTSEVYVIAPTYRLVKIEADILVAPNADLAEVKHLVEDNLTAYFNPLTGGSMGDGWDFGGDIFYSAVYREILQTLGVLRIQNNQMVIWLDHERQIFCRDVSINPGDLVYSTGHDIRVSYTAKAAA